jgi:hypothetical protein
MIKNQQEGEIRICWESYWKIYESKFKKKLNNLKNYQF